MQLAEWILDEGLYGVTVEVARDTFLAIKAVMVSECMWEEGLSGVTAEQSKLEGHDSPPESFVWLGTLMLADLSFRR